MIVGIGGHVQRASIVTEGAAASKPAALHPADGHFIIVRNEQVPHAQKRLPMDSHPAEIAMLTRFPGPTVFHATGLLAKAILTTGIAAIGAVATGFLSSVLLATVLLATGQTGSTASAQTIDTVAGTGKPDNNGNEGPAAETNVGQPFGVEVGPDGALYITEVSHHRVRRLNLATRTITTVAGNGKKGYAGDGGPAIEAELNEPYEVRFDNSGNMFFVEMKNHLVRRVDAETKIISTVAGTGEPGFGGDDGPANMARFHNPHSIALDHRGGLYVADIGNHRIRRIDLSSGIVQTIAGDGRRQLPAEGGPARGNPVLGPRALFVDGTTMWVALREGHSVWKLDLAANRWQHVAGTGKQGFTGDRGPGKVASFNGPKGIAVGPRGNVFVVDTENQAIRKLDVKSGVITTVAGAGPAQRGGRGDGGPATHAQLDRPHGIALGPDGTIYIGDTNNHRVRRVKAANP